VGQFTKIVSVNMPADAENRFQAIKMDKLGHLVLIAGRNGAGKTRFLRRLVKAAEYAARGKQDLQEVTRRAASEEVGTGFGRTGLEQQVRLIEEKVKRAELVLSGNGEPKLIHFLPRSELLVDPSTLTPDKLLLASNSVEQPGIENLPSGAFARLQSLQNRVWEVTHPKRSVTDEEARKEEDAYASLVLLIRQFLNTEVTRSADGVAELFGLPLGTCGLSEGQRVILQLCVAIHAQRTSLSELIILMDEPENYLHPAAALELIEVVRNNVPDGQIWIATHSVPLLASVDPSCIWWMEGNAVGKAGSKPDKVLTGLLGNEERREALASFLDLPAVLASNRFVAECLIGPSVVGFTSSDPQNRQIRDELIPLLEGAPVRILDFGAGKGRLALELAEALNEEQKEAALIT
jgi:predicted ATPase